MNASTQNPPTSFQKLFFTGVVAWILGSAVLFAASWTLAKPGSPVEAYMASLSYSGIAFAFGLGALVVRGALAKEALGSAVLAYLLPAVVITGLAGILLAIYPDQSFRDELAGYLPMLLVFYIFGFLWMKLRRARHFAFARAVLPPVLGGLMILAFVAGPVFTSNAFRYRNAFALTVLKSTESEETYVTEAVLEIRKPGDYRFTAPDFGNGGFEAGPATEAGKITWGTEGEPKEGMTGSFLLTIRSPKPTRRLEISAMPELMNSAILEARDARAPEVVIYTIFARLPAVAK